MGMELEIAADSSNPENALHSIRHGIVRALTSASLKETAEYDKLLFEWRELHLENPECDHFLQSRLKALSQAVSYIKDRDHKVLLSYVLGMSLWVHSFDVADALIEFVVNLASVNGGCVAQCLDMLVRNFLPPSSGLPVFVDFFTGRALMKGMPKEMLLQHKAKHMGKKDATLHRVHSAVRRIAELVPMTALHLPPIVLQRMPHKVVDKEWNALYMENMLRLGKDGKGDYIQNQMLMAVVDRLIQIDVEIRWEDIVREDDSSKIFVLDMEFDETLEESEAVLSGPGSEVQQLAGALRDSNRERRLTLCAVADKMDALMDMTLEHLQNCVNAGHMEQVFGALMTSFQSTILDTYKSKFTQFLIFYVCSLSPTTCGGKFASLLCDILTSTDRAPNTRMSAAAYLASFLARAKYLPLPIILSSLKRVTNWCVNYVPRQSDRKGSLTVDAGVHGVLYSACQAVMYVLCFRMRKLLDDPEQRTTLYSLPIGDLVRHSLNPLKLCLPSVVEEFLKQASAAHLLDENVSAEVNRSMEVLASNTFGGINRLDMFFPFDPYLLKQSDRFIRPNFVFWSMVQSQEGNDSDTDFEGNESELENSWATKEEDENGQPIPEITDGLHEHTDVGPVEGIGSISENQKDMDDFELSLNRMSLDPSEFVSTPFLKTLKAPLPLPAKLTHEFLRQFANPLM